VEIGPAGVGKAKCVLHGLFLLLVEKQTGPTTHNWLLGQLDLSQ
jgi:hypothetical protein